LVEEMKRKTIAARQEAKKEAIVNFILKNLEVITYQSRM
jgi:hypothetical protein